MVSPFEPFENGTYWGYQVRQANNLQEVFDGSIYEEPYDLKIGTSDRGEMSDFVDYTTKGSGFRRILLFFGGLDGIEGLVEQEEGMELKVSEVNKLFDFYINTCPEQGTRTIRTEEAILISLADLYPVFRAVGLHAPKQ